MCKYQRFLCLFLCLSIIVFVGIRPVQVSASTSALIEIRNSLGEVAQVIPAVYVIILVLIGVDWYYSHIDEIVAEAERIYNTSSVAVQTWAQSVADKLTEGTSAFKINKQVKNEVNLTLLPSGKKIPDGTAYVVAGLAFASALDYVTPEQVYLDTSSAILENINSSLVQVNSSIQLMSNNVTSAISSLHKETSMVYKQVYNGFITMRDGLSNLYSLIYNDNITFRDALRTFYSQMYHDNIQLRTSISDMYRMLSSKLGTEEGIFNSIAQNIKELPSTLSGAIGIQELSFDFNQKIDGITTSIRELSNNLGQKIDGLTSTVKEMIFPSNKPIEEVLPNLGVAEDYVAVENSLIGDSNEGFDKGLAYVGSASSLVQKYSVPFLCVMLLFKPFADLEFFDALLRISLGLAVCAIILNIGLAVARYDKNNDTSRKSAITKKVRGG